jgi:hypothetical protein
LLIIANRESGAITIQPETDNERGFMRDIIRNRAFLERLPSLGPRLEPGGSRSCQTWLRHAKEHTVPDDHIPDDHIVIRYPE